jgi:hypothetical protein
MAKFRDFVARQLPVTKVRRGSTPATRDRSRYEEAWEFTQFVFENFCG